MKYWRRRRLQAADDLGVLADEQRPVRHGGDIAGGLNTETQAGRGHVRMVGLPRRRSGAVADQHIVAVAVGHLPARREAM